MTHINSDLQWSLQSRKIRFCLGDGGGGGGHCWGYYISLVISIDNDTIMKHVNDESCFVFKLTSISSQIYSVIYSDKSTNISK